MKSKISALFAVLLYLVQTVSAQYYETGQDPASLKWMQIKTGRFTVIFPKDYGSEGLKYAKSFEESFSRLGLLYPRMKFRIPVVLHNFTIQSNGYVSWAPKRIELYPTPDQNGIPLAAETQLTVHELTHVMQLESLDRGFSRVMSYLFGEQFTGLDAVMLPSWFLEGDAVFAESYLTESGRGRVPSFQKELKALIVDKKNPYHYDKILNGSFRDFVPDYYESGFQMVTFGFARYGTGIWNNVLDFTGKDPFTLNPVNLRLSSDYGITKKKLWTETSDTLLKIWTKDILKNNPVQYNTANPDKNGTYISYNSPVYAGVDSIIAIKTSLSFPASFVLINPSKRTEKRINIPGTLYPMMISYARGKLVWVETESDPRWQNREYSTIKLMDLKTGRVRKLTQKSRYVAAVLSPNGTGIAAVENTVNNTNNLVLIDEVSGRVTGTFSTPANVYLQHPKWDEQGSISAVFLSDAGEGIISFNTANHDWNTLIQASRNDLQSSLLRNDSLFFISSASGTDNIYLQLPGYKARLLTDSRFGVIDVSQYGNKLIFSDYSSLGNNICTTAVTNVSEPDRLSIDSAAFLINRFRKPAFISDTSSVKYTPQPYRKWEHLLTFHSWMPFYADVVSFQTSPQSIRPGVTILTQNILSTLTSTIGYEYSADKRNVIHSRIKWEGWYPVVEAQLDYGTLTRVYKMGADIANPSIIRTGFDFLSTVSLPLQFQGGNFSQFIQPSVTFDYHNDYIYLKEPAVYDYGQTIITSRFYFSNYSRSALRDIYPRWAQVVDFNYSMAPDDKIIYGSSIAIKTSFYFPGLFPNNGIRLRFEAEKQNPGQYLYANVTSVPRGYQNLISEKISFFSADYVMPLAYPDFNLSSLLYIKRIRGAIFFDDAFGPMNSIYRISGNNLVPYNNTSDIVSFKSFGGQLLADFHVLRIPFLISAGIQSAWKNINSAPTVEFLFNIDLFGFTFGGRKM